MIANRDHASKQWLRAPVPRWQDRLVVIGCFLLVAMLAVRISQSQPRAEK